MCLLVEGTSTARQVRRLLFWRTPEAHPHPGYYTTYDIAQVQGFPLWNFDVGVILHTPALDPKAVDHATWVFAHFGSRVQVVHDIICQESVKRDAK